jgi:hypothetical protein
MWVLLVALLDTVVSALHPPPGAAPIIGFVTLSDKIRC